MSSSSEDADDRMQESQYEIIVDEGIISEEDDNSSVASFDGEDIVSISGSELLSEYAVDYITDSEPTSEAGGIPTFGGLDEHIIESLHDRSGSLKDIVFNEPSSTRPSVTYALQEFGEVEGRAIAEQLRFEMPSSTLRLSLRQSVIPQTLSMDQPFRVLYIGPDHAKDLIISKIGGALAVTALGTSDPLQENSKPARFNIVPVSSFGTASSPEIELVESFGVEIVVDHCTEASLKKEGKAEVFSLTLNKHQNVRAVSEGETTTMESAYWRKPHLAILLCAENEELQAKELRMEVRRFLTKFHVPTLLITEKSYFEMPYTETFSIDHKTLHFCLESGTPDQASIVHRRVPVDLAHFLAVDVRQMNRNLACVTGLFSTISERTEPEKGSKSAVDIQPPTDSRGWTLFEKKEAAGWRPNGVQIRLALLGWILLCGLFGSMASVSFSKYFLSMRDHTPPVSAISMTREVQLNFTSTLTTAASTPTVKSNVLSTTSTSTSSCHPMLASSSANIMRDSQDLTQNFSQDFELRIIGDRNILLRPSHQFTVLKRPPKLHVRVTRYGTTVPSEFSKLFSGVYSLQVPHDDAWGPLNVSVTTKSRPILDETFEIDFGRPWLKVSRWKSLASESSANALESLSFYRKRIALGAEQARSALSSKTDAAVSRIRSYVTDARRAQTEYVKYSKEGGEAIVRRAQGQAARIWRRGFH